MLRRIIASLITDTVMLAFSSIGDFYSNSLRIRTTGSLEEGKLIYESKSIKLILRLLVIVFIL